LSADVWQIVARTTDYTEDDYTNRQWAIDGSILTAQTETRSGKPNHTSFDNGMIFRTLQGEPVEDYSGDTDRVVVISRNAPVLNKNGEF